MNLNYIIFFEGESANRMHPQLQGLADTFIYLFIFFGYSWDCLRAPILSVPCFILILSSVIINLCNMM